ncbi:beta (1-6) glucan synthase [Methylotenera oryzisoli]|uniref:Endo-1,3-beta-glucanase btgC n=1 Tax=Methylotenera oryzisoli TaxID=2080758 RepID=A0A4Y9VSC6_9PROT|nr:beta (1-6) glucan synthase [Methylotenera oryzisoli]TFW71423.1 beta (1-6) glucan synthase [Methylotenera oryzisoli]
MQISPVKALSTKLLWRFCIFNIALLLGLIFWLWQASQPVNLIQPQLPNDGKLQCVSYSPYYHPGQTPLNPNSFIQPAQIDHDLAALSKRFNCVRIYSVSQGLSYVPEAASKLGIQVYLGAWIGWVAANNDKELDLAISVANKYPKTVKALIVGNEVLLRGEQSEAAMQAYLEKAQRSTLVPVTYADVWEFWRKHPKLEANVDFVTVHILPYWEDDPQAITEATQHVVNVMSLLAETFKKPILIGETGWPSVGRQRQASEPSLINQASYLRGFLQLAHDHAWQYNLIEAIDQPWKRDLEGTVGGYWGIFDTELTPKFAFTGDIQPRHDIKAIGLSGALGFALFLGLAFLFKARQVYMKLGLCAAGIVFGISVWLQTQYLISACRNITEWLTLSGLAFVGWLLVVGLIWRICQPSKHHALVLKTGVFILSVAAISATVLLIVDGRYRDFPISLYVLPILLLSFSSVFLEVDVKPKRWLGYVLSSVLMAAALYCVYLEIENISTYYWLGLCGLLIAALWPKSQASIRSSL